MNIDYQVYINADINADGVVIAPGVYDVIRDNSTYRKAACQAEIQTSTGRHWVPIRTADILGEPETGCYAVFPGFKPECLSTDKSESDMLTDLESLRPHYMTVDEYVNGYDDFHNGFVSVKAAWQAAVLHDNSYYLKSNEDMDRAFLSALAKHY